MTELWDKPRPQGYWPGTPNQFREATVDDCTWYATEFGFEAASQTHRSVHPVRELRNFSTDTVGGTPVAVAIRDTQNLWLDRERVVSTYGTRTKEQIITLLKRGAVLVYGGDYEKLPQHYRRWTNNDFFNHALATKTYDESADRTFMYDPLGGGPTFQPYDGEWISLNNVLDYCWQAGGTTYWVGVIENRGDEPMKSVNLNPNQPTDREVRVGKNTVVRVAPRTTSEAVRTVYSAQKWLPFIGRAPGGWRLIGWNLDESGKNIGYVHFDDIEEVRNVTPLVTGTDVEALKLANEALRDERSQLTIELRDKDAMLEVVTEDITAAYVTLTKE
jgi:hypothetical protein